MLRYVHVTPNARKSPRVEGLDWIGFLRRFIILEIRGFFKNLFVEGIQKYIYLWAMGVCRDVVRRLIGESTSCSDFKKNLKSFSKCTLRFVEKR